MKKREAKQSLEGIIPIGNSSISVRTDFQFKDFLQIVVGASILAVPIGFTKEAWELGKSLPSVNVIILVALTLCFIALFTYAHYHREHIHSNPRYHLLELTKRVFATYLVSFLLVALLLSLIKVAPWETNALIAYKMTAIVTFPSSLGAAISDTLH